MNRLLHACFVCCHPAPAAHFADFSQALAQSDIVCDFKAAETAYSTLKGRAIPVEDFYIPALVGTIPPLSQLPDEDAERLAESVAASCSTARVVITDVGSSFAARVQKKLAEKHPEILRVAYYDNPESYVPGGYSETAAKVMDQAQVILFANANLAKSLIYSQPGVAMNLSDKRCVGLGNSSLPQEVAKLKEARAIEKETGAQRAEFLRKHGIEDRGQRIAVYMGGANDVYFDYALPHFLNILPSKGETDPLAQTTIFIQQHPRAVIEGNKDGKLLEMWKAKLGAAAPEVVLSKVKFDEAVVVADAAMYYQTTANVKCLLGGINTFQVAYDTQKARHVPFDDVLTRNRLCAKTVTQDEFLQALEQKPAPIDEERVYTELLGINREWQRILTSLLADH